MEFPEKTFEFNRLFYDGDQDFTIASVCQIGESAVISGAEMWTHVQWCDEIIYALFGSATVYSDDEKNELVAGQFHYIKKGVSHKIVVNPDKRFRYICIGFEANKSQEVNSSFLQAVKDLDFYIGDGSTIQNTIESLVAEAYDDSKDTKTMISTYMLQLMIELSRIIGKKHRSSFGSEALSNPDSQKTLYRVLKHIDAEYRSIKTIRDVAQALSYNECYLSHMFRKKMDLTLKDYLMEKKISASAELLKSSNMTIDEISAYLSFGSANSFARAFKKIMAVSPQNYRNSK